MKKGIHPTYYSDATITCSCGNVVQAGSTVKELKTELCSACHPFYTGKQKLVDTAGRVDKFMAKMKKAKAYQDAKAGGSASDDKAKKDDKKDKKKEEKKEGSIKKTKTEEKNEEEREETEKSTEETPTEKAETKEEEK